MATIALLKSIVFLQFVAALFPKITPCKSHMTLILKQKAGLAQFSLLIEYYQKTQYMKSILERTSVSKGEPGEDFHMGGTIAIILLIMLFVGTSFYVLVSSYLQST